MVSGSPNETLAQLQKLSESNKNDISQKDVKLRACELARKLWLELEEPGDLIDRLVFQPAEDALLELALDLGIYDFLVRHDGPATSQDVASNLGTDSVLMSRILRALAALGHVDEVGIDIFQANKFSKAFTTAKGLNMARFCFDFAAPVWHAIPSHLKATQYQNPTNPMNAPVQRAFKSDKHFFGLLVETGLLETFQLAMSFYREGRPEFLDIFYADEQLIPGYDDSLRDDGVLLVDVGGGHGHDIQKFVEKFPDRKGRMILQDQSEVISQVPKSDHMEAMVHDFFAPQPVKGARAYYFRMIFHDWPDDRCLTILKHTAAAMKRGYSKLLINDIVLPDTGASRFATISDINMLALLAAMERSEAQWRKLLEQAGLKIVKVWQGTPESVIEAELAD